MSEQAVRLASGGKIATLGTSGKRTGETYERSNFFEVNTPPRLEGKRGAEKRWFGRWNPEEDESSVRRQKDGSWDDRRICVTEDREHQIF